MEHQHRGGGVVASGDVVDVSARGVEPEVPMLRVHVVTESFLDIHGRRRRRGPPSNGMLRPVPAGPGRCAPPGLPHDIRQEAGSHRRRGHDVSRAVPTDECESRGSCETYLFSLCLARGDGVNAGRISRHPDGRRRRRAPPRALASRRRRRRAMRPVGLPAGDRKGRRRVLRMRMILASGAHL